jgi:CubicO group peptidase (beta-lactamase class C family)
MKLGKGLRKDIDRLFSDYDRPSSPGCALGVVLDGELVYSRGYGMADLEHGVPITADTVFHLASVSKQFTATCIALLEEAGELALDDEARRYISYLPDYGHALQLKHLVYMTDGLEDFYEVAGLIMGVPEDSGFAHQEAVEVIRAADWLKFAPGDRWSYSNTAYFLLARIVEQVSGRPFALFAKEKIFDPLGMKSTFVRTDKRAIIPDRANGYARAGYVYYKAPERALDSRFVHLEDPMEISGAGQVWSTVNDLFLWDQNFYRNTLGRQDPRLVERMTTPDILNDGTPTCYAYGQLVADRDGSKVVFHEGGAAGVSAAIYRIPEKRVSVICLANSNDFLTVMLREHGMEVYEKIAAMALAEKLGGQPAAHVADPEPASVVSISVPFDRLEEVAGKYEDPDTSHILEVALTASGLTVKENFTQEFPLIPAASGESGEPVFCTQAKELRCVFCRDGDARSGPFTRIVVDKGSGPQTFWRFFALPLALATLQDYEGVYACPRLKTAFRVVAVETGLQLQNIDPRNDALNVVFAPTIRDMFMAQYPPFLSWYVIHFRREQGRVTAFVFRDEVPGRDNWVFERNG